ncbi:hypothetical protein WOJTEK_83 [Gordonia phage Wojtek]|uniref:Uncharacterized protein n=1 Tax=Gordonia phage Wojtek TaxID=2910758 RepID=A0AA49H0Q6_9CAUD|nr:hypothetical protein WOJTEK_83 [Gordonia phage Wojtek]WPH58037.1 hypothetical protein SEA_LUCKYLEO_89 [Gordonia phage LuckyLeo]
MDLTLSCNGRHRQCSRHHADLVQTYRAERERQELVLEGMEYQQSEDHQRPSLITFGEWLRGSRVNG